MAVGPFGPAAGKTRPCMRASGDVARYCGPATARLSAFPGVLFRNGSCAQRRTGLALERVPGYPTHGDFDETGFNSEAAWDSDISCTCAHFVSSMSHGGLMNVRPTPSDRLANPDAVLSRSDLRDLGYERRAVDAIFRACPIVSLPNYSRPLILVSDYRELVECSTYRDGARVRVS